MKIITSRPDFFAAFIAFIILILFPEVEIAISKSFFCPIASICLENILSKPKSFPIAVRFEGFVLNEREGKAFLSFSNLPTISEAI